MSDDIFVPVQQYVRTLLPPNIIELPDVEALDHVWMQPPNITYEPSLSLRTALMFEGPLAVGIPGVDAVQLVAAASGDTTVFMLEFDSQPAPVVRVVDVPIALRFSNDILKPVRRVTAADGTQQWEIDPDKSFVDVELATVTVAADLDGGFTFETDLSIDIPPSMIGDTGVVIEATDVSVHLDPANPPAGKPQGWKGVHIAHAGLYLPGELAGIVGNLEITDAYIGNGGFSGTVSDTWTPPLSASLFGVELELHRVEVTFVQNVLTASGIHGRMRLPFFDEMIEVELGIALDGGFTIRVASANGLLSLTKAGVLTVQVDSLGAQVDSGKLVVSLSGKLTPLLGAPGLQWPTVDLRELAIDSDGNVRVDGGWLNLPSQYALDFYAFKLEIARLGFGSTDDGGHWIGFSGGLKLVEGLSAGASVDGLRVTWYDDGRPPGMSLDGVGVEFEVPGAVRFRGAVSYRELVVDGETVHRFDGDISLELLALNLEIEAVLVIGSATGPAGSYTFFAVYLAAELPAGIPLWTTGLGLYGVAGLFALNMEPNRPADQPWYGLSPTEGWYHVPTVGVTDLRNKWKNRLGSLALGAGVTIGTVADNGFSFSGKLLLVIVFPGPIIMIEGKANLLRERSLLDEEPIFRALAVIDLREGTFLVGLDAQYEFASGGELIDIHGGAEAFYDFEDPLAWHLYLGEREPRERRIRARIFDLFEANAYFMLDANRLALGAWIGYERTWRFGPLRVVFEAWLEGNAVVSWKPVHFFGEVMAHGRAELSVFGFGLGLVIDARIAADVFDPFHLLGTFSVGISLPWPLPDFDVDIELEWGPEPDPPPLPMPLKEVAVEHLKVTTSWPLPRGQLLLPDYDGDGDGFLQAPTPALATQSAAAPPANLPVVPLDARPHITFGRSVHDAGLVSVNPQPVVPEWERLGDPALNQGPARAKFSLVEVTLDAWRNGGWVQVGRAGSGSNAAGVERLYGSWAAMPAMPGDGTNTGQVKLWLWSRTPFDYTGHTTSSWDEWFTDHYPLYPCIPAPEGRVVCCDFGALAIGTQVSSPWHCRVHGVTVAWTGAKTLPVERLAPPIGNGDRAICLAGDGSGRSMQAPIATHHSSKAAATRTVPMFVIILDQPASKVEVTIVDDHGVDVYTLSSSGFLGPFAGGTPSSPRVTVEGDDISRLIAIPRSGACLVQVCVTVEPTEEELAHVEEMATHLEDELIRWTQTGEVLKPNTTYRLGVKTKVEAVGEDELAGWSETTEHTEYAYFRTLGPPALTQLSVPIGHPEPDSFDSGLGDLTRYVAATVPSAIPPPGELPVLPRPVYRAYDVGVRFNEDYVDLMYRIAGRDLAIVLLDANRQPVRDARGRVVVGENTWGRAATRTQTKAESHWVQVVNDSSCVALDPSTFPTDPVLVTTRHDRVLDPDAVYDARLTPLLVHDDFRVPGNGATASGTGATLGRWVVRDVAAGTPSQWTVQLAGTPATRWVAQTTSVAGGTATASDPVKPGTLLLRANDPTLAGTHRDQPANWTDYRVTVAMRIAGNDAAGVVFRYVDVDHHYQFSMDRSRRYRRLTRNAMGNVTVLAEDRFAPQSGRDYTVTVEAVRDRLVVAMDGEVVFDVRDAALTRGGIGLYTWGASGARFADVRVDDVAADAPVAYAFSFTSGLYASFLDHLHAFDDRAMPAVSTTTPPTIGTLAWSDPQGAVGSGPSVDEARAYSALARSAIGAAVEQFAPQLEVTPVTVSGAVVGLLVRSPEPIEWARTTFQLARRTRPLPLPVAPGTAKLVAARFATVHAAEEQVDVLVRDTTSLAGHRVEHLVMPEAVAAPTADPVLFADDFAANAGLLFEETFGPNALDRYEIVDDGDELGPSAWAVAAGYVNQSTNIFGGPITGPEAHRPGTMAITGDPGWTDVAIDARIESGDDDAIGIVFRYQDRDTYYRFSMDRERSYRRLVRHVAGVTTVVWEDAVQYATNRAYDLRILVSGSRLIGYLDNVLLFDSDDASIPSGRVGFYCWGNVNARFRRLVVRQLVAPVRLAAPALASIDEVEVVTPATGGQGGQPAWAVTAGVLTQTSNFHVPSSSASFVGTMAILGDAEWRDVRVSCRLRSTDNDPIGLVFRYQDPDKYYRFSMDSQRSYRRLIRRVGGTVTVLWQDSTPYVVGQSYDLTLEAAGSSIQVWLDGQLLCARRDDRLRKGRIGAYVWANVGASFSRILVTDATRRVGRWVVHDDAASGTSSQWTVFAGALEQRGAPGDAAAPRRAGTWVEGSDRRWDDVRVVVRCRADSATGAVGIAFRIADEDNYYRISLDAADNRRRLVKVVDGVASVLWQTPGGYLASDDMTFVVDAVGDRLTVRLDGVVLCAVRDATHARGAVGLYTWGEAAARFDDVSVVTAPIALRALFVDRFADGDMSDWTIVDQGTESAPSSWAVSSGELRQSSNIHSLPVAASDAEKLGTVALAGSVTWTDVVFSVRIRSLDDDAIGVVFRYVDESNHYRFSMDRERAYRRLVRRVAGVTTVLWEDGVRYTQGRSYELTIVAAGSRISGWIDGVPVFVVEDASVALSSGRVGLYCWANADARFSNVQVLPRADVGDGWSMREHFLSFRRDHWRVADDSSSGDPSSWALAGAGGGSGVCQSASTGAGDAAMSNGAGTAAVWWERWGDVRVVAGVRTPAAGGGVAGVAVRWNGPADHYALLVDRAGGNLRFVRWSAGAATVLWTGGVAPAADHDALLTIDAVGDRFVGWLDGERLFDLDDPGGPAEGHVALRVAGAAGACFSRVLVGVPTWTTWYRFADAAADEPALAAGTVVRITSGQPVAGVALPAGTVSRVCADVGVPGRIRFRHDEARLRIIGPSASGHERSFAADASYAAVPSRVLRRADGTAFVIAAATPGAALARGDHRLLFTYRRDNQAVDATSNVLTRAGDSSPETAVLDVPASW